MKITPLLLSTFGVVSAISASELQLDPMIVSASTENSSASFTLVPTTPASSSLTLADLLVSEGLGTKVMKDINEENIVFRGLSQDSTLFLIDDIPMYKTVNGSVNTQLIGLSSLSSVAINRGETTTLHGAAPMGGVITLTPRKPTQPFETEIKTMADPMSRSAGIYMGTLQDKTYITFSGDTLNSSGYELSNHFQPTLIEDGGKRLNSDTKRSLADLKIGRVLDNGGEASIRLFRGTISMGIPPYVYQDSTTPFLNYERVTDAMNSGLYLSYDAPQINGWQWKGRVYGDKHTDTLLSYTDNTYTTLLFPASIYEDYRYGGLILGDYQFNDMTQLGIRALMEKNIHNHHDGSNPVRTFEAQTASLSTTLSTQLLSNVQGTLALGYERLTPTKTYQWTNPTDPTKNELRSPISAPTWQVTTRYDLDPKTTLNFSVGSKVKIPSLSQFFPFMPWDNINTSLKPERSLAWDMAYERRFQKSLLRIGGFYYDISDKIAYDTVTSTNYNIDKVTIRGIELTSNSEINPSNRMIFHYTYTDAQDNVGNLLDNTPPHRASLTYQWDPYRNWNIDTLINYSSMSTFHDGQASAQHLNPFMTADMKLSYSQGTATMMVGVRNITDSDYQTSWGYPQAGRTSYIALNWSYDGK
ncbi:MAG: TonB-dependent receptor [Candidatus Pacebacteria bacterium]|nr:TonB-dependent receptor [Candidatus Paceibacterota bacterium]